MNDNPYQQPAEQHDPLPAPDPRNALFFRRNELREVLWKITAVILLCMGLVSLIFATLTIGSRGGSGLWLLIAPPVLLVFAALTYRASRHWSRLVVDEAQVPIDGGILIMVQQVAFSVLGVILVAMALPGLAVEVPFALRDGFLSLETASRIIPDAIRLGLGGFLFFGSRGLSNLWQRFRTAGHGPRR